MDTGIPTYQNTLNYKGSLSLRNPDQSLVPDPALATTPIQAEPRALTGGVFRWPAGGTLEAGAVVGRCSVAPDCGPLA